MSAKIFNSVLNIEPEIVFSDVCRFPLLIYPYINQWNFVSVTFHYIIIRHYLYVIIWCSKHDDDSKIFRTPSTLYRNATLTIDRWTNVLFFSYTFASVSISIHILNCILARIWFQPISSPVALIPPRNTFALQYIYIIRE